MTLGLIKGKRGLRHRGIDHTGHQGHQSQIPRQKGTRSSRSACVKGRARRNGQTYHLPSRLNTRRLNPNSTPKFTNGGIRTIHCSSSGSQPPTTDEHEYGDNQVVWLENGREALNYMGADERFSAASFKDSMEEQGIAVNKNDLVALIDNMRGLSKQWRSSIGKHGELVFYIDAC